MLMWLNFIPHVNFETKESYFHVIFTNIKIVGVDIVEIETILTQEMYKLTLQNLYRKHKSYKKNT